MRNRTKLVLAGLTAALALGALVSASSANRFGLSGLQWRASWNTVGYQGFANVKCHATLEGSFHSRTISKVLEALVGYVTRVTVDSTNCTGGSARALTEKLPWHIRYGGFTGALPIITGIDLRLVGLTYYFQVAEISPEQCLFMSSAASPLRWIVNRNTATGVATSLRWDETARIPFTSGTSPFVCRGEQGLNFEGTSQALSEGPGGPSITVTLVQ
jgi:hypothetical protein